MSLENNTQFWSFREVLHGCEFDWEWFYECYATIKWIISQQFNFYSWFIIGEAICIWLYFLFILIRNFEWFKLINWEYQICSKNVGKFNVPTCGSFLFDCLLKLKKKTYFSHVFFNAHSENVLFSDTFFLKLSRFKFSLLCIC